MKTTQNGRKQNVKIYRTEACGGCPMRANVRRARGTVDRAQRRSSEAPAQGARDARKRERRRTEETTVRGRGGDRKHKGKQEIQKVLTEGLAKVQIEIGLIAIAHNLQRLATV
ncbi:MAG: transposase [Acidobacteria bacterium]|nr:transposase [Acidobacteriota bacterium]